MEFDEDEHENEIVIEVLDYETGWVIMTVQREESTYKNDLKKLRIVKLKIPC